MLLCWCYMKYRTLHQGVGNDWKEHMCVGFIFWDVEINNDFEDITLATRVIFALPVTIKERVIHFGCLREVKIKT